MIGRFSQFEDFHRVSGQRKKYALRRSLKWEVGAKGSGWVLTINKGTAFDISVPWCLEWIQSPHDRRVLPAAAIHDELLKQGHDIAFASSEFRRAAIARGTSPGWAWVLFLTTLIWMSFKK